jgi:hypothetical protein
MQHHLRRPATIGNREQPQFDRVRNLEIAQPLQRLAGDADLHGAIDTGPDEVDLRLHDPKGAGSSGCRRRESNSHDP